MSRRMRRGGGGPCRRARFALSCTAICVGGNGTPKSSFASSTIRRRVMPLPHESHHLPAAVIAGRGEGCCVGDPKGSRFILSRLVYVTLSVVELSPKAIAEREREGVVGRRRELTPSGDDV